MKHFAEEDLIAYQMNESDNTVAIAEHLEVCRECASVAESIAETLRVFSAEPVPQTNIDQAWQRMRGNLPVLAPAPQRRWRWSWLAIPAAAMAILLIALVALYPHTSKRTTDSTARLAPGPLTSEPRNPDLATHIDSAERLLTEVSHTSGPLDEATRRQAHELLLSNAVYVRQADANGDVTDAAVLEDLSRTLTTLEHETDRKKNDDGWHLRVEMNTDGLLLDLRILQQNDNASTKESQ